MSSLLSYEPWQFPLVGRRVHFISYQIQKTRRLLNESRVLPVATTSLAARHLPLARSRLNLVTHRQDAVECRTSVWIILHPKMPAVGFDNRAANGESHAEAGTLRGIKRLKDFIDPVA